MSSQEEHRPEEHKPCPPSPKPSAVDLVTPAKHEKMNAGSSSSSVKSKPPAKERGSGNPAMADLWTQPYSDPSSSTVDPACEKKVKAELAWKRKKREQQSFEDSIERICGEMDRPL
eukprot:11227274-Karenia_brevis.AAC.1